MDGCVMFRFPEPPFDLPPLVVCCIDFGFVLPWSERGVFLEPFGDLFPRICLLCRVSSWLLLLRGCEPAFGLFDLCSQFDH